MTHETRSYVQYWLANGDLPLVTPPLFPKLPRVIPQHVIDRVLEQTDLALYIGEYVALRSLAGSHTACCPFHEEKTPSFRVYERHYHCYGCGAHGNALNFAMNYVGLPFRDALAGLASRVGISLEETPAATSRPMAEGTDTLRAACGFFQQKLQAPEGAAARDELARRGIDDDSIMRFGIGYAPSGWNALTGNDRFSAPELATLGLALPRRNGSGHIDLFRDRLMFPVCTFDGSVIGFGGRRLGDEGPKYLNSPETPLYQKSQVLFGLPQAKAAIRRTRSVIVCEGFFDVVVPAQHGVENILSTCGTAFTVGQAELLLSIADRLIFCFDGDGAGMKAARDAAQMMLPLLSDYQEVFICTLPGRHDPDSYVREAGVEAFQAVIDTAPSLTQFILREMLAPAARAGSATLLRDAVRLWQGIAAPALALCFRQAVCDAVGASASEFMALATLATPEPDATLRDCPCCGAPSIHDATEQGVRVVCRSCGLSTPYLPDEKNCTKRWNRREAPRYRAAQAHAKPNQRSAP